MKKLLLPFIGSLLFASTMDNVLLDFNKKNYSDAIKLLKKEKKTEQVKFLLGKAYFERHLTMTDYKFAFKYLSKLKTPQSYYYLGRMYEKGLGVKQNGEEAVRYYKLSNTKEAKYELAKLYLQGKFVLKNPQLAISLLEKSAKAGYTKAQFLLGKLYLMGNKVVDKDLRKATKWLYLSAKNGDLEAKKLWDKYQLYRFQ